MIKSASEDLYKNGILRDIRRELVSMLRRGY